MEVYRERYVIRYSLHIARSSDKGSFPSSQFTIDDLSGDPIRDAKA
jgi:hypothetical protein